MLDWIFKTLVTIFLITAVAHNAEASAMDRYYRNIASRAKEALIEEMDRNLTSAIDDAFDQIKIPLFTGNPLEGEDLHQKMLEFQDQLRKQLGDDFQQSIVDMLKNRKDKLQQLSEEEKGKAKDNLLMKWGKSLKKTLSLWKKTFLYGWLIKIRDIWHGMERAIKAQLDKLISFWKRHMLRSSQEKMLAHDEQTTGQTDEAQQEKAIIENALQALPISNNNNSASVAAYSSLEKRGMDAETIEFLRTVLTSVTLSMNVPLIFLIHGSVFSFDRMLDKGIQMASY